MSWNTREDCFVFHVQHARLGKTCEKIVFGRSIKNFRNLFLLASFLKEPSTLPAFSGIFLSVKNTSYKNCCGKKLLLTETYLFIIHIKFFNGAPLYQRRQFKTSKICTQYSKYIKISQRFTASAMLFRKPSELPYIIEL